MVDFRTVYLYWRWSSRVRCCRSLMGTLGREWGDRSLLGTVYSVVDYGAVDLYWGRCCRIWRCRSLLGTVW